MTTRTAPQSPDDAPSDRLMTVTEMCAELGGRFRGSSQRDLVRGA
jgi:hypothetical protein